MGPLLLFLTTFIWGTAFLAQKIGGEALGPFAMTCFRNVLGGGFLLVLIWLRDRGAFAKAFTRGSVLGGVACGTPLCLAMVAQQIGIGYTTPGISAFLTTNYMFFIPLISLVLWRRLPRWYVWTGVALALVGTYFICMAGETMTVGKGELWTILCAFVFAIQMLVVDHYAPKCDVLVLSAVQLLTCSVVSAPFLALDAEQAALASFAFGWKTALPVVYCGVFSSGIAYTLQNFGQARTPPAVAGVILSMESVFGALSGYFALGDRMTAPQFVGCALVLFAAISTQLFSSRR